jgi:hypothetical protein
MVVTYSKFCPGSCLEGLRKTMINIRLAGVPAGITENLPNNSRKCYRYTNPFCILGCDAVSIGR